MTGDRRERALAAVAAVAAVAVVAAACSSAGSRGGTTPAELPSKSRPTTVTGTPATTTTFGALEQAVIRIDNPDGMVAIGQDLWVKTDDGRAVRIDPRTNKVTAQISLDTVSDPGNYCQGIGTDGAWVWACAAEDDGTAVAQLDPISGRVVRRVHVDKVFDQLSLPATKRGIWVLTGDGSTVQVIDPRNGQPSAYQLGVVCQQLAAEGDRLVAADSVTNSLVLLNTATGAVIGRTHLPGPRITAMLDGDVWVDTDDGLTRLGPDLAVRAVYPGVIASSGGDVVAAVGSIWVRAADGTISRIDPGTGQLVERIKPDRPLTAGSLYIAFGSIWTTSSDDGRVVRLRITG